MSDANENQNRRNDDRGNRRRDDRRREDNPRNSGDDGLRESRVIDINRVAKVCLLYTSPSPRDRTRSRMPSSA